MIFGIYGLEHEGSETWIRFIYPQPKSTPSLYLQSIPTNLKTIDRDVKLERLTKSEGELLKLVLQAS